MKNPILALIIFFATLSLFSQEINGVSLKNTPKYSENSEIRVVYKNDLINKDNDENVAYFINGIQVEKQAVMILNSDKVESINIEKNKLELNGKEYNGKLNVTTKENYKPNFITLKKLVSIYLSKETNPNIFQLDDTLINQNENDYLVDENNILKIEVTKIKNPKLNSDINFIKIVTKTPENIEKANIIQIRGTDI